MIQMRLLLLFCLLAPLLAPAQQDSIRNELGFSTNIVFDRIFSSSSYGAPVELMYKRKVGKNHLRMGLDLSHYSDKKNTELGYFYEQTTTYTGVSFSGGYELRTPLHPRWNMQWGSDLVYHYTNRTDTLYHYVPSLQHPINNKKISSTHRIELRPFYGIMFSITPRLLLSTEASLTASYSSNNEENISMQEGRTQEGEYFRYKFREFHSTKSRNLQVNPASAIFVYYRF